MTRLLWAWDAKVRFGGCSVQKVSGTPRRKCKKELLKDSWTVSPILIKYFETTTVYVKSSLDLTGDVFCLDYHDLGPESTFGWKAFLTRIENDHLKQVFQEKHSLRRS